MKTYAPKLKEIERKWHVIDANGQTLGRLSVQIARLLIGKHKAMFTNNTDTGGKDITIISIDGVKGIFQAIVNGEANCTVECNPLLGPQAVQAVRDLRDGKKLPARIWTIEGIFDASNAATALPSRQY
ncbi:MAG: uL13 family ribosomal protein [Dehalococcoidia bacterium]